MPHQPLRPAAQIHGAMRIERNQRLGKKHGARDSGDGAINSDVQTTP